MNYNTTPPPTMSPASTRVCRDPDVSNFTFLATKGRFQ